MHSPHLKTSHSANPLKLPPDLSHPVPDSLFSHPRHDPIRWCQKCQGILSDTRNSHSQSDWNQIHIPVVAQMLELRAPTKSTSPLRAYSSLSFRYNRLSFCTTNNSKCAYDDCVLYRSVISCDCDDSEDSEMFTSNCCQIFF